MDLSCRLTASTRPWRRVLALYLLPVLLSLVPLAHASPPDPTWLAGFYDNADFDDVVAVVVSATAILSNVVLVSTDAADVAAGAVCSQGDVVGVAAESSSFTIRAPPSTARIATQ